MMLLANAGTPLLWLTGAHLLIGNLLIGLCEGALLATFFKARQVPAVPLMIVANYASAWLGAALLAHHEAPPQRLTIETVVGGLAGLYGLLFVVTLLVEAPFVLLSLRISKPPRWLLRASLGLVTINVASYAILGLFYLGAGDFSALTAVRRVDPSVLSRNQGTLLFLDAETGALCSMRLDGRDRRELRPSRFTDRDDRLEISSERVVAFGRNGREELFPAPPGLPGSAPCMTRECGSWFSFGEVADLRPESNRQWKARLGFWAHEGLFAYKGEERLHVALDVPGANWYARNGIVLPQEQMVFQLGDQIVLVDFDQRKIALLARGRGPIVILD